MEDTSTSCPPSDAMIETEVTAGRMSFDMTVATQCVQQTVEPTSCTDYWNNGPTVPDACNSVFAGLIADGAACDDSATQTAPTRARAVTARFGAAAAG